MVIIATVQFFLIYSYAEQKYQEAKEISELSEQLGGIFIPVVKMPINLPLLLVSYIIPFIIPFVLDFRQTPQPTL